MKRGFLLFVFVIVYSLTARSQINKMGAPLISWFDAADTPGNLINLSITMDKRGVMYFGNESNGIVTYDGSGWDLISMKSPQRVTSLATDTRGVVFVGGENDIGFLQPDLSGKLTYYSLAGKSSDATLPGRVMTITSIAADSSKVYFTDGKGLYIFDIRGDSLTVIDIERNYGLSNACRLLTVDRRMVIADNRKGLFEYVDGTITPLPGGENISMTHFVKLLQYDRDNILIGTAERGLELFNLRTGTLNRRFLRKEDARRLIRDPLSDVVILPGNMIAAGLSHRGGVYIFSHEGKLLQHITDETTSVRESSVTAMYCDYASNSQLWFCTKGFINKAYVSLPACEFGDASGIHSVAGSFVEFEDSVFVGTAYGLYKNYVDGSGIMRFRVLEYPDSEVNDLLGLNMPEGKVLLAATSDGLWQTDEYGDDTGFLNGTHLTALGSSVNNTSLLVAGSADGIIRTLIYSKGEWSVVNTSRRDDVKGRVTAIIGSERDDWWILTSSPTSLIKMHCEASDTTFTGYGPEQGADCDTINSIILLDKKLYLCTGRGLYSFNPDNDAFTRDHDLIGNTFDNVAVNKIIKTPDGDIFLSGYDTRDFNALVRTTSQGHIIFRRQFDFLPDIPTTGMAFIEGNVWIAKGLSIFVIDNAKLGFSYGAFSVFFTRINAGKRWLMEGSFYTFTPEAVRILSTLQPVDEGIILNHNNNDITFRWTATSYVGEGSTEYSYRLDNLDDDWSDWQKRTYRDYTNLPSGDYTFRLKARTITGLESEEVTYSFSVKRDWYGSLLAIILYVAAASVILFFVISYFTRKLKRLNSRLESLLSKRREAAERSKEEVASLEQYSGAVQNALQPSEKRLAEIFPNSFIFNKPRQIISGDFCWMAGGTERFTVAVGDCTGHGVTSAFRTLMVMYLLNETARREVDAMPSEILRSLQERLVSFKTTPTSLQAEPESTALALLTVDRTIDIIEFAGAAMQCYRVTEMNYDEVSGWKNGNIGDDNTILTDGKYRLETVPGDRMPLGISMPGRGVFTKHEWKLEKDTSYYIFTDGYSDQFNGVSGKKFMKKNFRKLILDIQKYPMKKQKEILEERLQSWMGSSSQTDDILVVGFRIE